MAGLIEAITSYKVLKGTWLCIAKCPGFGEASLLHYLKDWTFTALHRSPWREEANYFRRKTLIGGIGLFKCGSGGGLVVNMKGVCKRDEWWAFGEEPSERAATQWPHLSS